ncbi:MAG: DUF445 domain-containing protein [Granulosicoccus sp.]
MLTKNTVPNLIAVALIGLSFLLPPPYSAVLLSTALFALSGALTNWLAVYMLFDRVPGLYGSGVIALHFEDFKAGILRMVHEELLAKDSVERLMTNSSSNPTSPDAAIDISPMLEAIDLDAAYDQLVATITESSFGSMLAMVGGEAALQPLRDPFKERMGKFLADTARSPRIQALVSEQIGKVATSDSFVQKLDQLLRTRLDELTPDMVKDIMQRMIKRHLGWLVVWGGVFGGLIGLLAGLLQLS